MAQLAFNLTAFNSYTEELPVIDIMKMSRPFTGGWSGLTHQQLIDGGYLDSTGWPISIPGGGSGPIRTVWESTSVLRAGDYVMTWDGNGTISLNNVINLVTVSPRRVTFTARPGGDTFWLDVTATDSAPDNIRNIRIVRASEEALALEGEVFAPRFLSFVSSSGASTLRFMDWMRTNGSAQSSWADRPVGDYSTWATTKGMPLETMVALANRLRVTPWFTFPHLATDEYVTNFATYVRDNLDAGLLARFEYSNETWNSSFPQTSYCQTQGDAAAWTSAYAGFYKSQLWAGYRMGQCSEIVRAVYGTDSGTGWEGVLATWPDSTDITNKRIIGLNYHIEEEDGSAGRAISTLFSDMAVTTYFGGGAISNSTNRAELIEYFGSHTAEECYAWINAKMLDPASSTWGCIPAIALKWADIKAISDTLNISLSAYEGGTHIVHLFGLEGIIPSETRDLIYPILIAHAYTEWMGELYAASWDAWEAITDGPYTHFVSIGQPSYYGTWGVKRTYDDLNPRWAALTSKSRGLPYQPGFVGVTANVSA